MKKIVRKLYILPLLMLACFLVSCTHNNGDIGSLFGTWKLTAILIDGQLAEDYSGNCFWSFQNDIIAFTLEDDPLSHSAQRRWGTFVRSEGYISLNLSHKGNGANDYLYQIFPVLRLPAEEDVPLKILKDSGGEMELELTAVDGSRIVYTLKKQ